MATIEKIKCKICNKNLGKRNFYSSNIKEYEEYCYGCAPYCKDCLKSATLDKKGIINKANFISVLKKLDKPFVEELYNKTVLEREEDALPTYLKYLNLDKNYRNKRFEDTQNLNENNNNEDAISKIKTQTVQTEEDIKVETDIKRLLDYDPFDGYEVFDKKYLNSDLLPYLNEDTLEDQFKISVIIQIVNNNNQIRKIDLVINQLSSSTESLINNGSDIKNLTSIKAQLNQANDRLSKENSIALKHRGDSQAGKSTLGAIMKDLRELDFEKAEHNYYTLKQSYGIKVTADISNKSILDVINFDSNDQNTLFKEQRDLIQKLQKKELDYKEEIRNLLKESKKLKEKIDRFEKLEMENKIQNKGDGKDGK